MGNLLKNLNFGSILTGGMSTAIDGLVGIGTAAIQNKMSKKLMNYQNNLNIKNWQMANEYNKPINQMARFREAGLNPNLIYGNMENTATSLSSPSAESASIDRRNNLMQNIQMAASLRQMEAQTKLLNAKTLRENVEAAYTEERSKQQQWYNSDAYRSNALKLLTGNARYMDYHADVEESNATWASSFNRLRFDLESAKRILYHDQHDLNQLQGELLKSNNSLVQSKIALNGAMLLTQFAMADNFRANSELARKNVEVLSKQINKIIQETRNLEKSGKLIDQNYLNQRIKNILLNQFGKEQLTGNLTEAASTLSGAISRLFGQKWTNTEIP